MKAFKKISGFLLIGTLLFSISAQAQQIKYTNQTADMRKGPAAFHELLMRLYVNNKVQLDTTEGYWDRILFQQQLGWVPSYTLSDEKLDSKKLQSDSLQSRMGLMFSQLNNEDPLTEKDLVASPTQVSAAVKGFAKKWRKARNLEYTVDFEKYQIESPSPTEFENFIGVRNRPLTRIQKRKLLYPGPTFVPFTDPTIDQIGYAVASAVAQKGLISNYPLQRYLDLISGLIVENSHRPELDFKVFILDIEEIEGYSLPGNYIFISKGALKQMRAEAELVHFLSHEIAHLVFSHGMVEYKEQEPRVKQEDMLAEMRAKLAENNSENQATDEERENEQRISDWADGFYEAANSERLESYELDADYWGVIYTYLSGYNPNESIKYLKRIEGYESESISEWSGLPLQKRLDALNKQIKSLNLGTGNTNSDLFDRLINSLD